MPIFYIADKKIVKKCECAEGMDWDELYRKTNSPEYYNITDW